MNRTLLFAAVPLLAAGCYYSEPQPQPPPPPQYVAQPPPPDYVIVNQPPPPIVVEEQRPDAPGLGYVWVDGYYGWSGQQYVWAPGRWEMPPSGFGIWIGPRYDRDQRGYRYTAGHWQQGHQDWRDQRGDRR
ncbi:MAG: YXWGXW repeat-containing protein [Tepidisphaeraceae bacterium]|jgi:hypothetical protein